MIHFHSKRDVVLETERLSKSYPIRRGLFRRTVDEVSAVREVSLRLYKGRTLGLVGESGCGKTSLIRTILGLQPATSGRVWLTMENGSSDEQSQNNRIDLHAVTGDQRLLARRNVQILFQNAMSAMNPRMRVGQIVAEPLSIHGIGSRQERRQRVAQLLEDVALDSSFANRFPASLSGGQRQRVGIARALALKPKILLCDEPVSALDVSVQSEILNLLNRLQQEQGLTYLFISHNLNVVKYMSDRIAVMYLGRVVEEGPANEVYAQPKHPYTELLLNSMPATHPKFRGNSVCSDDRKETVASSNLGVDEAPHSRSLPTGCAFHPRCAYAEEQCRADVPEVESLECGEIACHKHQLLALKGGKQ